MITRTSPRNQERLFKPAAAGGCRRLPAASAIDPLLGLRILPRRRTVARRVRPGWHDRLWRYPGPAVFQAAREREAMTQKTITMPVSTRCGCYPGSGWPRAQCDNRATHWLIHEDGTENPGGYVCLDHGESIIAEIRDKTGEAWTLAEITKL